MRLRKPREITQVHVGKTSAYPMTNWNGAVVGGTQQAVFSRRAPFSEDYDFTSPLFRRLVNTGAHDVQLPSGLTGRAFQGVRYPYKGAGWLDVTVPFAPGYQRNYAPNGGYYPNAPSAPQLQRIIQETAGAQAVSPGGPGMIAGTEFVNPMTG